MRTLDLNKYDVLEMSAGEMKETGGGNIWARGARWLFRVIRDGAAYDVIKGAAQHYKYDPDVNYTPWYGPMGGGFK